MNQVLLRTSFSLFLLFGFFGSSYCFGFYLTELAANERKRWLDEKAWSITNSMSEEELVGQTIHIAIPSKTVDQIALDEIKQTKPGGIILFGKNLGKKEEILSLTENLQIVAKENGLQPFLISTDQEGGRVFRVQDGITHYPGAMAVGQTGKKEWGEIVGFVTSYELRSLGLNFLFAPVLDINNNPLNPVINTRSFGSDVNRVSEVAVAYEKGARAGGCLPVIKHFPGHGDTTVDSHLGLPIINKSLEELEKLELVPFKQSIQGGAEAVMSAHIVYPKIDPNFPATLSKTILTDVLRKSLQFDGIIITDAMEMHAISKNYEKDRPGVLTILAGANIVLLTSWGETAKKFKAQLMDAYKKGEFRFVDKEGKERDILKEAVQKQIRKKLELGIYDANSILPTVYEENQKQKEFLTTWEKERNDRYTTLSKSLFFAKEINEDSIRAYPKAVNTAQILPEQTLSFVKNPKLKEVLKSKKIQSVPPKSFGSYVKQKAYTTYLFDSTSEPEILYVVSLAKKFPNKRFLVMHGGTPFIQLPEMQNVDYLLSFSLTVGSWEAIGVKLTSGKEIPKVDLILLTKELKTPSKGAFPESL
ncbi:glycoside hydrolase family 3 protein [Leptospira levettii]|uniref:beta-N-acetylhexosaminidase n=1 Tax=Leptospira levettii TaxID=2023178 RepID=A0AAW5VAW9_9LEPT|nr:glycoside hydrolase family 3 protein [Leptospira levettii]MCW7464533.1 glycoside hydrolase family 3 protein [Leptospira levettii]MCW7511283.1 glycoside hydrolase family 3 protein [Leptospira levettii]MCW7515037.1 glycoside hydrolase family 3 protein [Leptospira levettii]